MKETKHERYLRLKKEKQMKALKSANKNLQKTVAVVGATTVAGLALAPKSHAYTVSSYQGQTPAQQFLNKIIPAAQQATEGQDVYTSVMIAQAALESAWGQSALASEPNHNLFGVKGSYNGQSVNMYTLEDAGAQKYYGIYDNFRKYPSYKESMDDYVDKIVNGIKGAPMFYAGAWKSRTNSYQDATRYLTGRYATDTAYYAKLNRIIEQYGLTKYDNGVVTKTNNSVVASNVSTQSGATAANGYYTVKAGDTLYGISRKFGMSLSQLVSVNGISASSLIVPGQTLRVAGGETTSTVVKTTATTSRTSGGNYLVQPGDTLYSIARRSGMSLNSLLTLNGLSQSSVIYPGQSLTISQSDNRVATKSSYTAKPLASGASTSGTYTVQAGDTLYSIARRSGMSLNTLLSLNGLSQSSVIHPGQTLKLSGASNATVASPVSYKSTASSASTSGTYTVQAGDTLYSIARRSGMSLNTLLSINGLSQSSVIRPGQTLSVSGSASQTTATPVSYQTTSTSTGNGTYTVKAGDTLYRIAYNHGISLTTLLSINGLSETSTIRPGQQLVVSGSAKATTSTTKATTVSYSTGASTHTVQAGDTLFRIAKNNGLTLSELRALNGLTSNTIRVGQVLKVSK